MINGSQLFRYILDVCLSFECASDNFTAFMSFGYFSNYTRTSINYCSRTSLNAWRACILIRTARIFSCPCCHMTPGSIALVYALFVNAFLLVNFIITFNKLLQFLLYIGDK